MIVNTFRCEECTKLRDPDINHWRLGVHRDGAIEFRSWDDEIAAQESVLHLCSDDCCILSFRAWMEKQKETK